MPLGKYYCDYCDKEFQDTAVARRRHLQSSSHLRSRSLWYNNLNFVNHSRINRPSAAAFPLRLCNRFVNTGFCPYGDSCKYSHPPPVSQVGGSPIISGDHLVGGSPLQGDVVRDGMGMSWGNLPPSLRPPPEGGYLPLPFVDWG